MIKIISKHYLKMYFFSKEMGSNKHKTRPPFKPYSGERMHFGIIDR